LRWRLELVRSAASTLDRPDKVLLDFFF
jgi:hypothetical protein